MNSLTKILLGALMVMMTTACAKEKGSEVNPAIGAAPTAVVPSGTPPPAGVGENPVQTGYYSGSTALLQADLSKLRQMFYNSTPNNPTNVRVNIDMSRMRDSIIVSFQEGVGGPVREAALGSVNPCVETGVYPCNSNANRMYNGTVNQDGAPVWKGFFQDRYGAIVVVIDRFFGQGDGQSGQFVGGSIWFQNFNQNVPNYPYQGPLKMCWEITEGPYDCRSFLVNNAVSMTSSLYPTTKGPHQYNYYQKLGDFNGISKAAANIPGL